MFESFVLRRSENGDPITPGQIAEALLFYQKVHLLLDSGSLPSLCKALTPEVFLGLLSRPNVSAVYCEQFLGVQTTTSARLEKHSFIAGHFSGTAEKKQMNRRQRLEHIFEKIGCDRKRAARLADRFQTLAKAKSVTDDYFIAGGIPKAAESDIRDPAFIKDAVRIAADSFKPASVSLPEFDFELIPVGGGYAVSSDLDLNVLNSGGGKITHAGLLTHVLTARADLIFAAHYGCDFQTSVVSSRIVERRCAEILRRKGLNDTEISEFRTLVLADLPRLREVIDSGQRSFTEFLRFLDSRQSQKFNKWVSHVGADDKLVASYFAEVRAQSWIERLPGKFSRYAMTSAIGLVGPLTGLAVSAADTFLVNRILGGWKPNHFIEGSYTDFVGTP